MNSPTRLTAADLMTRDVATASPRWSLRELERVLTREGVSGLPVVHGDQLIGVVSRSDILRQANVERSRAEQISDYFRSDDSSPNEILASIRDEEHFVASRLSDELVEDVMSKAVFSVPPSATIREVAMVLSEHRIHRVPVVDDRQLAGIISSLDIVSYVARAELGSE